jgi:signal transduction histidine kinase
VTTTLAQPAQTQPLAGPPGGRTALTPADLLSSFNEVTARLQASHDQLRGEVARLSTELRAANEQVERSRRLAALGEMAAGIAHEVRNPLGSIRLYARMLEEDLVACPSQAGLAAKITSATRVVEAIVGDVLSFAREFRLRPQEVSSRDLFERSVECCRHDGVPGWRAVEVVVTGKDVEVSCDPSLVQQVLVNLVRNAFEAMAEVAGGPYRLELSASRSRVAVKEGARARREAAVVLRVRDTGPGVPPGVVERMFNPFFTTRGQGTGLGLSIVHRIIDAHGGRVIVRNNSECADAPAGFARGACVDVVLPALGARAGSGGLAPADSERSPSEEPGLMEGAGVETST